MKRKLIAVLSLALAIIMLIPAAALAEETGAQAEPTAAPAEEAEAVTNLTAAEEAAAQMSILDEEKLNTEVKELLAKYGISENGRSKASFAYTYTGTGDSWYYNADEWMYAASMYKVPMMMVLAERVAKGEITQETDLGGCTLTQAEELVLVHSNNNYAHVVRSYLGGDEVARKLYQGYSSLEESYYHADFMDYCYFTARYMNDVMVTLHEEPERFPQITEYLKLAMPQNYFHLAIDPEIAVAQKYGSFTERNGTVVNNNTGIVYTPNPFILTVMTENLGVDQAEHMMGEAAKLFLDYTLTLDEKLQTYQNELEEAKLAAEEARAAEEEARAAEERARQQEAEEAERKKQEEEAAKAAAEEEQRLQQEKAAKKAATKEKWGKVLKILIAVAVVVAVLGLAFLVTRHRMRKKWQMQEEARRVEEVRRRRYGLEEPEEEESRMDVVRNGWNRLQQEGRKNAEKMRKATGRDSYRPKH